MGNIIYWSDYSDYLE